MTSKWQGDGTVQFDDGEPLPAVDLDDTFNKVNTIFNNFAFVNARISGAEVFAADAERTEIFIVVISMTTANNNSKFFRVNDGSTDVIDINTSTEAVPNTQFRTASITSGVTGAITFTISVDEHVGVAMYFVKRTQ